MNESEQKLLELVPVSGSIGTQRLKEALGWDNERFTATRDALVELGVLRIGPGRGGSVIRVEQQLLQAPAPGVNAQTVAAKKESDLYPGFLQGLKAWAGDQGWTDHLVEQLAHQGSRNTGGFWTRPDFVVVGYRKFEYTPGVVRDVETFEVKLAGCGISAVFETAAHSRAATKSYLAIEQAGDSDDPEELGRIEAECQRFGLGLITFTSPGDLATWIYRVEPLRQEPDPHSLERFIEDQIPSHQKTRIRKWLK